MKQRLLRLLLGRKTYQELLMCLNGAVYCMTHEVMDSTKEFELKHIKNMIRVLEGE